MYQRVLSLFIKGESIKQISGRLAIDENYVKSILDKVPKEKKERKRVSD